MSQPKYTKKDTIKYYNDCTWQYARGWDLNTSMAYHGGYWDETTKNLTDAIRRENEVLAEIAKIKPEDHVLDAGCGVGGSSVFLAKKTGCKVTGITVVPKQVIMATKYAKDQGVDDKVLFLERDYLDTKLPNESFNVIWSIESVCYAEPKKQYLEEAYRLLKTGGRLIMADLFQAKEILTEKESRLLNDKTFNRVAVNELGRESYFKEHAKRIGFKNIRFEDITEKTLPSFRLMYLSSIKNMIQGWILYKFRFFNKIEYENLLVGLNLRRSRKKRLWKYGLFYAEK
jgi:tocopherol O-methyltransferase